jgi:Protein of unknown function (DUF551)
MFTPTIIDHQSGQKLHAASWIATADRLPDDDMCVLVFVPDQNDQVWLGYISSEHGEWLCVSGSTCEPTHWMELPEPPVLSK